jgi:hypothetical protein
MKDQIMKQLLTVSILLIGFSSSIYAGQNQFCAGFERGYVTGHKQSSGSSFAPFTPFCPFQPFKGFNDPKSDYEHGYVIGYEKGVQEGQN